MPAIFTLFDGTVRKSCSTGGIELISANIAFCQSHPTAVVDVDDNLDHFVIGQDAAAVEAGIERYYRNYHPAGYGTHVSNRCLEGNTHVVLMHRWASCD